MSRRKAGGDGGGGGKGAGRKKGAQNKVNEARKAAAIGNGPTPLEVLMEQMRYFQARAEKLRKQGKDPARLLTMMDAAMKRAEAAAPFIHPKLQSVTQKQEPLNLDDLTEEELKVVLAIKQRLASRSTGSDQHRVH